LTQGVFDDGQLHIMEEQVGVVLDAPLSVVPPVDGASIEGSTAASVDLPIGQTVCAYLLYVDSHYTIGDVDAVFDFGLPILGYATTNADLAASDRFENPATTYDYDGLGSTDIIVSTGTEIDLHAKFNIFGTDQARLFLAC
jgi:hypothetical protein